ncbi:MAG: hypothetical protein ACOYL6_06285 [Bacteriovoracaceae bacterium]
MKTSMILIFFLSSFITRDQIGYLMIQENGLGRITLIERILNTI